MDIVRRIVECLTAARRVLIATHEKPDGDAVGSVLGLARILRARGQVAIPLPLAPLPRRYRSFVAAGELDGAEALKPMPGDVLAVLDCGALDRVAPAVASGIRPGVTVLNIDHHLSNTQFGNVNWVDPSACSVGEMIVRLAEGAGWDIPAGAAEALWVAIVTDTGRFAYENTSREALRAAGALLRHAMPTADIDRRLYESLSLKEFRLRQRAMARLELLEHGHVAAVSLTIEDFAAEDAGPEDAEDIVNLPRCIEGVRVAVFFCELRKRGDDGAPRRVTKVGVRSIAPFDAAALCRGFGGGGHARAAGCTIEAALVEARARFLPALAGV
jgi:phosphoesterase RecJ-like protein